MLLLVQLVKFLETQKKKSFSFDSGKVNYMKNRQPFQECEKKEKKTLNAHYYLDIKTRPENKLSWEESAFDQDKLFKWLLTEGHEYKLNEEWVLEQFLL